MTMSECESWDDVCNTKSKQSMQDQHHHPDDLEFLTNQLVESLTPEIENIVAILHKLQLPLDGIPMHSEEVDSARLEDESVHQEKEEEDEEEEEERKSGGFRLAPALIRMCRSDVEKSSTEEEATLCAALIQVLEELEMMNAVDCLRRIADIWRKQDKEPGSSSAEAGQTQVPSPQKTSPGVASFRCHRTVLRETLATLVDRLAITDTLLSILTKKSVINQHMVALVLGRPNRQQQVVQLIELLTQLGPYSLQVFIEALTETDNIALANALKWSLRHAPRDVDN